MVLEIQWSSDARMHGGVFSAMVYFAETYEGLWIRDIEFLRFYWYIQKIEALTLVCWEPIKLNLDEQAKRLEVVAR